MVRGYGAGTLKYNTWLRSHCRNPNLPADAALKLTRWPSYNTASQDYIRFDGNLTSFPIEHHYAGSRIHFWNEFFPVLLEECKVCRPRWLSWMRRPTGDQEVAGSTPAEVGNILSWRLIMKYFLRSFSPFRWYKKGSCQFLAKECAQYWLTA